MNSKVLSLIIVLILVALGFFLYMGRSVAPTDVSIEEIVDMSSSAEDASEEAGVVEVAIDASNFAYSIEAIEAKRGDTVRITLTNTQGMHDLVVEGYEVGTEVLSAGESETIEFVVDEEGTFEYYCSVGTHREIGMVGTLTVTE